jgi:hypothetical protein
MQSVAVTRCVSVTGGHADKTPWVISNFESINGVEYIPLSMRDSGFNRFVAGAGSRGICGKSGDFLTKLRELRATATHVGKSESDALFTPTAAAIKKQRLMSREASKRGELPATVEIEAPGFVSDGVQVEPMKLIVKSSLHVSDMLWVQATGPVLEYIKAGVRSQLGQERVGNTIDHNRGIRWKKNRCCWFATRKEDGKCVYKTFRPEGDDETNKQHALRLAREWVNE